MARSICEYLQSRMREYIAEKNVSVRWLGKQTALDNSTIYRLYNGEQKNLSFANAKAILYFISPAEADNILADYYPVEAQGLGTAKGVDELVAILADNLPLYKVFSFAEMKGVERADVKDEFGRQGLLLLDKLIELGILIETGKAFKSALEGRAYPPEEINKKIAIHHYRMVSLSVDGSIIENMREGLSDEGIRELYEAVAELRAKALKIALEKKGNRLAVLSVIAGPGVLNEV